MGVGDEGLCSGGGTIEITSCQNAAQVKFSRCVNGGGVAISIQYVNRAGQYRLAYRSLCR